MSSFYKNYFLSQSLVLHPFLLFFFPFLLLLGGNATATASSLSNTSNGDLHFQMASRPKDAEELFMAGVQQYREQKYQEAISFYQKALVIQRDLNENLSVSRTLNAIGLCYYYLDQFSEALSYYQQALTVLNRLDKGTNAEVQNRRGQVLNNIGLIYQETAQYDQAWTTFQEALAIQKTTENMEEVSKTLNNLGSVALYLGRYADALNYLQQSLSVGDYQDEDERGKTLGNIGIAYEALGNYSVASDYYQRSLRIFENSNNWSEQGEILDSLGRLYNLEGRYAQAIQFYQQAIALHQKSGKRLSDARTRNNLGWTYVRIRQPDQALPLLQQAIGIAQTQGDRQSEGNMLDSLGYTYKALGKIEEATTAYQQALVIRREIGDVEGEGVTLSHLGELFEQQQQPELAIVFYKQSVNVREGIRQGIRSLPRELQQSYTDTVADTYRALADLLLSQDRILEAHQVLDLLKLQELEAYLRNNVRSSGQPLIVLRPEEEILKKYNGLQQGAITAGKELFELEKRARSGDSLTPAENERKNNLVTLRQQLNQQLNDFINSADVQAFLKQLSPKEIEARIPFDVLRSAGKTMAQLNAVLLYPLVLENRLELIITVPNAQPLRRTVNGVGRQQLNEAILEFRKNLVPYRNPKPAAQKLYNWLIQPIEKDLQASKATTIIYAPDGQLRYIPLAALYDGQRWLVERYQINNITARAIDDLTTHSQPQPRILAGAFGAEAKTVSVAGRTFDFTGLNFTTQEVELLAKLLPNTRSLFGAKFTVKETINNMNDYTIVHLATHAQLVPEAADQSFIVFRDEVATLKDIDNWTLDNVDLIVLSACETGLGGKFGKNGEEVLGLGYQFTKRDKARAAIASLWPVDDGGTQILMTAFYGALRQGMSKAQALQAAQNALITGDYSQVGGNTSDQNLKHPYYWAPFILIGNGL